MIYVVEIKDDAEIFDPSLENQKKFEYAQAHFERLNSWLGDNGVATRYQHNLAIAKVVQPVLSIST